MALIYLYFLLAFLVGIMAAVRGRMAWPWFVIALFLTPVIAGLVLVSLPTLKGSHWYSDWEDKPLPRGIIPMPANSRIRIIRRFSRVDDHRSCEIFVIGAEVGTVAPGSVVEFPVPSGRLTVEACIDWADSPPLTVEAVPGQRVDIEVSNRGGPLLALWAKAFPTESYLRLRPVRHPPASEAA